MGRSAMSSEEPGRIAIDQVVEAATAGVLRALEARDVSARQFARDNGLFVKFEVTAGAWPGPPPEDLGSGEEPLSS
jgi:hypothetical protein